MRDTYDLGDKLVIVTTDRQSAFDRLLAAIPFKGQVLNQTSAWWMQQTQHIVKNALLSGAEPPCLRCMAARPTACGAALVPCALGDPLAACTSPCLTRAPVPPCCCPAQCLTPMHAS